MFSFTQSPIKLFRRAGFGMFGACLCLVATSAAPAKAPSDRNLEGKFLCWNTHGKAEFRRDSTYLFTPAGGQPGKDGRWAVLENGTLSIALRGGENQYVKLDRVGSKVTMLDGDKWSGHVCR